MATDPSRIHDPICFAEEFELDLGSYELRRAGRPVKLERIPMDLLLLLIERRGQLVTRDEIAARIWGSGVHLDTDNSINGAIRKLRQALQDDPESPRFIQTVTGKGYRFIASVDAPDPLPPPRLEAVPPPPASTRRRTWIRMALAGTLLVVGAFYAWSRWEGRSRAVVGRVMIAVLPFENLTGDATQEYFSDGLTEEMISRLGNLDPQHLGVIARTSVMPYKHGSRTLDQIARELGVQYVLEGSVRRDTNRVRITAQLIKTGDQSHVWARQYDRELTSLLAVQGEIAQAVADEVRVTLGGRRRRGNDLALSPEGYAAYDLYLQGRFHWNQRTVNSLQHALAFFEQAVERNPRDARAYAAIADTYTLLTGYSATPPEHWLPLARTAARKAIELDPDLAEAHISLALIAQNYDWDWNTAEREYRQGLQLNPNYATAHHWYAEYLALQGRFGEAVSEIERARQLDPLSLIIKTDHGAILLMARRYDEAIAQFEPVLKVDPMFPRTSLVAYAYLEKGMFREAVAVTQKRQGVEDNVWSLAIRAYVAGRTGHRDEARHIVAEMKHFYDRGPVDAAPMLLAYLGMHDKQASFDWLEKAYRQRSGSLNSLKVNPIFDPLRDDPRFYELLRRMGLES